jgi:hypothetical protein
VDEHEQDGEQALGSVGELAQLYLGNILYALEMAALSLEQQNKAADASFYRGIAHKLADAHGQAKQSRGS